MLRTKRKSRQSRLLSSSPKASPGVKTGSTPGSPLYLNRSTTPRRSAASAAKFLPTTTHRPLSDAVRKELEPQVGMKLDHVRVHSDSYAHAVADGLDANALTYGNHIYLGTGQSPDDLPLMAHEVTHVAQQSGESLAPGTGTQVTVRTKPNKQQSLQTKYKISISKGDKDWSASDLEDLRWVLAKLSKKETAALHGYQFIRWTNKENRKKKDPNYVETGVEECGVHEPDLATNTFKISFYDTCFKDPEATSETMAGVPIERFRLMHEIGHAMEIAELRRADAEHTKALAAFNAAVKAHNAATGKKRRKLKAHALRLDEAEKKAKKKLDAANGRVLTKFGTLVKDKTPLTSYSKTGAAEAFAEAFALYKVDPKGLMKTNPALAKWFKQHGHLHP